MGSFDKVLAVLAGGPECVKSEGGDCNPGAVKAKMEGGFFQSSRVSSRVSESHCHTK